ncbi:hypothetical protein Ct9H90mP29_05820 [bacterium]|nr:MAG: hypothetical protein Ct9H90mP29_05820 [bacterium]
MIELTLEQIKPDHFFIRGDKVASTVKGLVHHSPKTSVKVLGLENRLLM